MKRRRIAAMAACLTSAAMLMQVTAINYWDEWGPMENWTDEQWAQSDKWSEAQWEEYWAYEEAAWDLEMKKEEGLTNLDGINVLLNGTYLEFADAEPVNRDGRVMLPFRTVFEALEADEVSFDPATKTVKALWGNEVDKTITMTIGSTTALVEAGGGEPEKLEMDVAPYIDAATGRTMIPVRFVSEAAGCDVYWNSNVDVVNIIDRQALVDWMDSNLTIYNRAMKVSVEELEAKYRTVSDMELAASLYTDDGEDSIRLWGNAEVLSQGVNMSATGKLGLDTTEVDDSLLVNLPEEIRTILEQVKEIPFAFILNGDEGAMYFQSSILKQLDPSMDENTWLEYQDPMMKSMLSSTMEMLKGGNLTLGNLMYDSLWENREMLYGYDNVYDQMKEVGGILHAMMGDDGFRKSGNSYVMELDTLGLMKRITQYAGGSMEGMSLDEMMAQLQNIPNMKYRLALSFNGDVLNKIEMGFNVNIDNIEVPTEIYFTLQGDRMNAKMEMGVKGRYIGKITATMNSRAYETSQEPLQVVPDGDPVVPINGMIPTVIPMA
ncbi:MAG: stalk domain-containing protein [Eubacteriales bacterium]|jgi:hypothetical protein